jgi:hypothetical protein
VSNVTYGLVKVADRAFGVQREANKASEMALERDSAGIIDCPGLLLLGRFPAAEREPKG